ncbi:hypothetical protein D3C79_719530 [compost metagenome]
MAHHVFGFEEVERQAIDPLQHFQGVAQAGFGAARQVHLGDVAGHHRLGVEADAGQEHLHLLGGGVLGLVQDDEGVIEGAAAHIGERRHFDDVALHQLLDALEAQHLEQGVIEGAQVGIDLLGEIPGQEAEFLTGFHRRAGQQDAADLLALQGIHGGGHREIGLAGTGRTDTEADVVAHYVGDVLGLVRAAGLDEAALGLDRHLLAMGLARRFLIVLLQHTGLLHRQVHHLGGDVGHLAALEGLGFHIEVLEDDGDGVHLGLLAEQLEVVVTVADLDAETALQLLEIVVEGTAQAGEAQVVGGLQVQVQGRDVSAQNVLVSAVSPSGWRRGRG